MKLKNHTNKQKCLINFIRLDLAEHKILSASSDKESNCLSDASSKPYRNTGNDKNEVIKLYQLCMIKNNQSKKELATYRTTGNDKIVV